MKKTTIFIMILIIINFNVYLDENNNEVINPNESNILVLDEDTAVDLALKNNLGIKNDKLKFQGAIWQLATCWNVLIPTVSMSASLIRSNLNEDDRTQEIPDFANMTVFPVFNIPTEEKTSPLWTVSANFNLNFNFNATMIFQIYQTGLDFRNGKINLDTAKTKLIWDVKKNLYNIMLLKKNIEISQDSLDIAEKRYKNAVVNYKNGLMSEYDMLSAQVAYENLKPQFLEMNNNYLEALLYFKQVLGIKADTEIEFNTQIEIEEKEYYNADELIQKHLFKNPDIKIFNNQLRSLMNKRNLNIAVLTPSFNIMFTMDPTFQKDAIENKWFQINDPDDDEYDDDRDYIEDNWKQRTGALTLSLSLPISTWAPFSKEQMNIVKSQYDIQIAKNQLKDLIEKSQIKIKMLILQLEKSKKSIESLKINIQLAEKAFKKAEQAYYAGSKELLEVQNSEKELKQAKLNLLNEEYKYTTGVLELEYLLNTKL